MAADDTKGYDSKTQKGEQLEALKVEYELHKRFGRDDRAKEVAAYAKAHHNASLTTTRHAAAAD